ncbi:VanZ family protein [Microbacterium suwonense]|uniref:VanZ-like domain-containing protein n=1 Tax=Microbacterium suwonense TaxID=683047 RepID=A0ABM8FUG7_9MICO|nr:VanZ family protein [Microbacterium suwonense]BDZ39205.1 hypothetical protein GCM10025863_18190 [Microbacterium suwonense]
MPAPRLSPFTIIARVALVPYAIALGLIVWLPASAASKVTDVVFRFARFVSAHTPVPLGLSYTVFEFLANIALFVPLGLLLVAAWPRANAWVVLLLGYATSVTIELVQTLLPSRFTTLSDVIANTLGTAIGCVIARMLVQRHPPRMPVEPPLATWDEIIADQPAARR